MKRIFCTTILFLGLVGLVSARIVDQIVAYVNEDIITLHELENRLEERQLELLQVYRFSQSEATERANQEREQLLDQMARERLLYQEAQRRQIEVAETEVDLYTDDFKKQAGIQTDDQLLQELGRRGLSLESFREQARQNLMAQNLVLQEIVPNLNVTDAEIDQFFAENRSDFPTKLDEVTLRHIFINFEPSETDVETTRAETARILELVKQPDADFASLVREYSQNPQTRELDGLLGLRPDQYESLPEAFQQTVNALQINEIGGPVQAHGGFHIVRLEARTEEVIQVRHIFLPIVAGEKARNTAQERIATVRTRLENGEAFAQVAQELSEDEETKKVGGELGTLSLSEFPAEIRGVLETMTVGQFSTPIPTRFGIHVFLLEDRRPAELSTEEREQIRVMLRQKEFETKWHQFTGRLKDRAFVKFKLP